MSFTLEQMPLFETKQLSNFEREALNVTERILSSLGRSIFVNVAPNYTTLVFRARPSMAFHSGVHGSTLVEAVEKMLNTPKPARKKRTTRRRQP